MPLCCSPRSAESLSRFKFAHLLDGGDPIATGKVQVITQPLRFVSGSAPPIRPSRTGSARRSPSAWWRSACSTGITRSVSTRRRLPALGEFAVGNNQSDGMDAYLDGLLDEATEPPSHPSQINPEAKKQAGRTALLISLSPAGREALKFRGQAPRPPTFGFGR